MKTLTKLSAFLVGSLMLLAAISPAFAISSPIEAPGMNSVGINDATAKSINWNGNAETGSSVTSASGSWVVPSITGAISSTDYFSAIWVGIDGYSDQTVEQTGILSETIGGVTTYFAWYEFYPSAMVELPGTVKAGDSITATVTYAGTSSGSTFPSPSSVFGSPNIAFSNPSNVFPNPGDPFGRAGTKFTVNIADSTEGWSYTATVTDSSTPARSSAEWIVEAPEVSINGGQFKLYSLPDFGVITFTSCTAAATSLSSPIPITMINENTGATMAVPTTLSSGTFTDTWVSAGP